MGSIAFVAACRSVWAIAKDERRSRRPATTAAAGQIKHFRGLGRISIYAAPSGTGLKTRCRISKTSPTRSPTPCRTRAIAPNHALRGPQPECQQEAEDFLRDALADGPQPTKQVETEAREGYGITATTMKRARKTLGIESLRPTIPGPWNLACPTQSATRPTLPYTNNLTLLTLLQNHREKVAILPLEN